MKKVYLVGAGPGDPELITLKGQRVLAGADVVLYDNLANPALLEHAPAAEHIYVGKKRAEHACTQDEIIDLMIDRAHRGQCVVRLKGGDPFIFGRGGEEAEGLGRAGIPYEVVPGVTTPLGIAAYAGIPLTHREHTSVVAFVTGHDVASIDWKKTGLSDTLVIFMGLQHLDDIVQELLAAGRSPVTPAVAVRWATRPDQQVVAGTLAELPQLVQAAGLRPPATFIIGEVAGLRDRLTWFERLPLFGKQIVVTRGRDQAEDFLRGLRDLGADPVHLPVIELAPLEDYSVLDASIASLEQYDWIVFTSTNAVDFFLQRLSACGRDLRAIRAALCAIGPATASRLTDLHLNVDLIPERHDSEGVAAAFERFEMQGRRVLLPRASAAREVIPTALAGLGAQVDIADAYRNIIPSDAKARIEAYLARGRRPDWITFTSGSTVTNWLALAGPDSLAGVRIASIGPATSRVAVAHGLKVEAEANPSTTEGLIGAILSRL